VKPSAGYRPLAYSSPEAVQTTGTTAFTHRELRDYVERIRTQVLTIKNAAKAQLIGAQDQKFYLEFDTHQLAGLGVSRDQVISSLQEQNAVTPSGVVQTGL
jgi:multidrug efflux pump